MEPMRLQKALAVAGIASRRAAESLIREGRVTVNGQPVEKMGMLVEPGRDMIRVNGQTVSFNAPPLTLLLNKPAGTLCSANPDQGRTVFELLNGIHERLFTVGRLDKESEGLLLLTNDGDLANRLTHPRYAHEKVYEVTVGGRVSTSALRQLGQPVMIDDKTTQPATVTPMGWNPREQCTTLRFVLREGRNRQIRRLCEVANLQIRRLIRTQIGGVTLGNLKPGAFRPLTRRELDTLTDRTAHPAEGNSNG